MIVARTRKWGNSLGIVLPKEETDRLKIAEDEDVVLDVRKKDNPLKELFGSGKGGNIGVANLRKMRLEWESKHDMP